MVDFTVPFHLQFAVSLCDIIHYSRKKKKSVIASKVTVDTISMSF